MVFTPQRDVALHSVWCLLQWEEPEILVLWGIEDVAGTAPVSTMYFSIATINVAGECFKQALVVMSLFFLGKSSTKKTFPLDSAILKTVF